MADVVKNGRTKGGRTRFTAPNVQRMMGEQPKLTSKEAQSMMKELGIAIVGGGALKIGKVLYGSIGAAAKALAKIPKSEARRLLTAASKTRNVKTGKPQAKLPPPTGTTPPVLSKIGRAREARRNPVNKNQGLASIRSTPKPQKDTVQAGSRLVKRKTTQPVGASKAASKPKVPAIRKTTQPTVRNSKDKASTLKDKSFINPLLPLAKAAFTGVSLNSLLSKAPKTPKPSKKPKFDNTVDDEGTGALFKPEYDNTVDDEGTGAKLKPKKSKKKKDPDYKLYSGDLAKKYDLKYMTGEAMERDETKRIADGAKSGGHLKKLKNSRKVTKKFKGGFRGKGAGCARRGF